ncbi:hypothetical protein BDV28DRAFT_144857 [Aspergillus coremiiformis]|uniref:RING-type domain-containing protein n=1 Tax=Aspergillus coremiiformis TaxID=138285 RepID=A0A5N6ZGX9_9EURO|nr:hypothetical protein BDV28DRAFT_144857 [Aspergillus coremiiformis]
MFLTLDFIESDSDEVKPDNYTRRIAGTITQFGDGAKVLKISLPSDFSAVHLSKLPAGSTPTSVASTLDKLGFGVPIDCVRVLPQGDTAHCGADIRVEDPSFAKTVCDKLGSICGKTPQIDAVIINAPLPQEYNSRRVDCKRVHCSWHRPFRTAWLNFGSKDLAQKIHERFKAGTYKVLDQMVQSADPSGRADYRNPQSWSVSLTDVPAMTTKQDILRSIPVATHPRHVELGPPAYTVDITTANVSVKSKLMQAGPLEWWEDAGVTGGKRAKAKARFRNEEDARKAVELLNGTALPFTKQGKLTVQLVYSVKMEVLERVYKAVHWMIDAQKHVWRSQHLALVAYDPVQGHRTLKIEGEDSKNVAQAKNTLEKILDGEVAAREGKPLWTESIMGNGSAYSSLKSIEQRLGVAIVRNMRQSWLHIYGTAQKCKKAQALIAMLVENDSSSTHTINLNQERTVKFDVISVPKRIVVTGSDEDFKLAWGMVMERRSAAQPTKDDAELEDCAVCWTEAEDPVHTQCGHTYCADCFERLCFAGDISSKEFCVSCEGDSGNCKKVLAISEIQEQLLSNVLEDVLQTSFNSQIRRHPQDFHYCPTPDCGNVYRVGSKAGCLTCSKCLVMTCTMCHFSHAGMTCAEYKDHTSGGYKAFEKVKEQLGIKDCPKCKTSMEKTEGCNHMTCRGCGIHICWACMKTFETSGPCYEHMNRAHGSIGIDIADDDLGIY